MNTIYRVANTVGPVHMSPNGSTYLTVEAYSGPDNTEIEIEPPIEVVFEGEDASVVAVTQDGLAARYYDDELSEIGEGNSVKGLNRVIGEIATNGNLERGAFKPLLSDEKLEQVRADLQHFYDGSFRI